AEWPGLAGLKMLDVSHCDLRDRGAIALAAAPKLSGLRWLFINSNQVGAVGIKALLPKLPALTMLDLSDNLLRGDAARALAGVKTPRSRRVLNLAGNGIDDAGVAALAGSPRLKKLVGLDLEDNSLSGEGLAALAGSLHLGKLAWLSLDSCDLGAEDMQQWPAK